MTKTPKKPDTVRVWHPGYQAEANPKRADLEKWTEQGWQVQPAQKEIKE